jgi:hypothetical protein
MRFHPAREAADGQCEDQQFVEERFSGEVCVDGRYDRFDPHSSARIADLCDIARLTTARR